MKDISLSNLMAEKNRNQILKFKDVNSKLPSCGSNEKMRPKTSNDWSVVTRTRRPTAKKIFSRENNESIKNGKKSYINCNNHLVSNKTREDDKYALGDKLLKRELLYFFKSVVRPFGGGNRLCKNAENQLILSDTNINKIKIFDLSGNLETIVGSPESGTPLESPDRIYMCPRTRVMVVVERPPYRMIKVLVALFPITSFSYEATNPEDICMDSSFKIFLLDSPSKIIYIYDTTGVLLNVLHCPDFLYPCNIDVNQHEELFVCDKERHCVEVINYKGKKLRTIGGEGITDFPIFIKVGKNDEVIICNNYNILKITIFNRMGDEILVALQSMLRLEKLLDVTITCNGRVFVSTSDGDLVMMEFPFIAFDKLKWKRIQIKNKRKKMEYWEHEYPENAENEVWKNGTVGRSLTKNVEFSDEKSFNEFSVKRLIIENSEREFPNESENLKDGIWHFKKKCLNDQISVENEQYEENKRIKLYNNDTTAENESTEDDIWDMSFVTNVKVKNEELFDNILAQSQQFESCERMLFEKSEYALPVESESVEKDISFTEHVGVNNDESFNHISIDIKHLEENGITPFENIDASARINQDDGWSTSFLKNIHIRNMWNNSTPTQNVAKNIWSNVVLEHDMDNHIRNIWSDKM
ncbi:hypothetical protein HELRODRAFT_172965 [Helobdella robusta]|uniref:Uncharacterized protein n=1 Tax=Helobdella robusta TaxID=6412 RepID=T1F681_HELRO|nr:hypothetical protein HELRODRAFT_172965 [Helobdella robusta]ESO03935.1 hypothetical protein HELRODRAFT_172965 [Helobdella robusta]